MDMGPFWNEIVDYIKPVIKEKKNDNNVETDYVKFALYSGHDSTIAPLMASLSPNIWNNTNFPWYASMMIIEVRYEILLFVHTHTHTRTRTRTLIKRLVNLLNYLYATDSRGYW